MNSIKQMILSDWHFMRIIRLVLGAFMAVNAIMMHDALPGLLAGIFLVQAFTNTGCCCAGSCQLPLSKTNERTETIFEGIKNN